MVPVLQRQGMGGRGQGGGCPRLCPEQAARWGQIWGMWGDKRGKGKGTG